MDPDPKKQLTEAAAATPLDNAVSTPMGEAKASIQAFVASLWPKLSTILARLGNEYLLCLHKEISKSEQVTKLENEDDYIPISARVKFSLRNSKLVEQEEDYKTLVAETNDLVEAFQKNLKSKILAATKLEVKKLKAAKLDTLTLNLRMCVESCLLYETSSTQTVNIDKFLHTLLFLYNNIFEDIDIIKAEFIET